ncbi:DsrE family protein [Arenibacter sp. F20364]|uniref:DsrE family protein n=1 Tax=Arenibacter sp. F20364 TaxID=2926415 RepID=UPI001FF37AB9|nr:DsrE family protein [Arenibacter sp. F20364]MCK0192933.1 DsrE family protein [Arenibacter sp. F20364]
MSKTAIVVLSDPKEGSDEALGRVFNALGTVYEFKVANEEVKIIFQGAGTRWPEILQKEDHPANALYKAIEDKIEGISCACADVFGADASGLDLIKNNPLPGTSGSSSYAALQNDGYTIINF